jgi:hypothetical protein
MRGNENEPEPIPLGSKNLSNSKECPLGHVFVDLNAEGFEKFEVLIADFQLRIAGESSDERSFVGGFFALFADPNGGFEDEEDVIAVIFDSGDHFGDLLGIGERLIDGITQFLHELLELLIHGTPSGRPSQGEVTNLLVSGLIVTLNIDKIDR